VPGGVASCPIQQQTQFGAPSADARCGQLVITAANGKTSIDTVTVTIGGKTPTWLQPGQSIQSAIDQAAPGDLIIVPRGVYTEMVLMWKPVRLQGVGAASSVIDANAHPAGKLLTPWRRQVGCLFGLTPDGRPNTNSTAPNCSQVPSLASLPAAQLYASGGPNFPTMIVDRVPTEGILGWDTTLNGNLAEQLIEPSLMGAYEGAAITVLGKGVNIPSGGPAIDAWGTGAEAAYPDGTVLLSANDCATGPRVRGGGEGSPRQNLYPGNFYCNPSSIDGLGLRNSSQGGGGIFVHGWGHNIQLANNRVYGNTGSLSGGITVGQGEHVDLPLAGEAVVLPPGSCESSPIPNLGLPFCYNTFVNVHHNAVTLNSSLGDELFSSTPAGAGGVSISNGSDHYRFTNNWVCGNMSTGDGGGVAHIGWSEGGLIEHNAILFNQTTNPTITTNGGGLLVMGAPDPDPPCGVNNDKDCVADPASIGPSDGTGLGLVINANLILGNSADAGSGGGLRLQHVNGTDVMNFPDGNTACSRDLSSCNWSSVSVTNNIIANNVAGWDGAGISLQDALAVNIVNNTIVSNDATASSGVLFNSLFAPLASAPGTNCNNQAGTGSCPQVAGLVSVTNSPVLQANLPAGLTCPQGHGSGGSCGLYSVPLLFNDVFWQNRSFFIGVKGFGAGNQNQQMLVSLFNAFSGTPAASQPATDATTPDGTGLVITGGTGACTPGASYWDLGVRGDQGPGNHSSLGGTTLALSPIYSVLTDPTLYSGANNTGGSQHDPTFLSEYCNGSRVPPEDVCKDANGATVPCGWQVPPGTNETNALPTPVFSLSPSATVDEGNNWVNMRWGPLSLLNPVSGTTLGNYGPASSSSVINLIPSSATVAYGLAPLVDFYGTSRKNGFVDAGAVEFAGGGGGGGGGGGPSRAATVSPGTLAFGNWAAGTTSNSLTVTVTNTGTLALAGGTFTFAGGSVHFSRTGGTCGSNLAVGASCTIDVAFTPGGGGPNTYTRTLTVAYGGGATVTPSVVTLTGSRVSMAVNPTALSFTAAAGTASPTQTLTIRNSTGGTRTLTITGLAAPFSRPNGGAGGSCGATLGSGATCTVNIRFTAPAAPGTSHGSVTITTSGGFTVFNSPVSLTGVSQ
jgi:hypothetical protein